MEGKARRRKEKVEDQHADGGGKNAAQPVGGDHRDDEHAQQIDRDDIRLGHAQRSEQKAHQRRSQQHKRAFSHVARRHAHAPRPKTAARAISALSRRVGDDVNVEIRRGGNEPLGERGLAEDASARGGAAANDDLGHAGQPRELRDLVRHILAIAGLNARAELPGQARVFAQPPLVLLAHGGVGRRLDIQRRKRAAEGTCHARGRADDLRIGRRG